MDIPVLESQHGLMVTTLDVECEDVGFTKLIRCLSCENKVGVVLYMPFRAPGTKGRIKI